MARVSSSQHPLTLSPHALPWKPLSAAIEHILHWSQSGDVSETSLLSHRQGAAESDPLLYQSEISRALLQAQERDRQRIAADLHDSIGQNLSVVKMTIETVLRDLAERSGQARQQRALTAALTRVRLTIDELRRIALDLRPSMLEELGLLATLDWCCREFAETNPGMNLTKEITLEEEDVPPAMRCDLYRVIQEALHNVTKHASAENVVLALHRVDSDLVLSISDDGCGFDPQEKSGAGIGLYSMQARSERGGGDIQIRSALGRGTSIKVCCPLPQDSQTAEKDNAELEKRRRLSERRRGERREQND